MAEYYQFVYCGEYMVVKYQHSFVQFSLNSKKVLENKIWAVNPARFIRDINDY